MKPVYLLNCSLLVASLLVTYCFAQDGAAGGAAVDRSWIQRFDTNGDGKIDDEERRAVRKKMSQMSNRPGAMTPSDKTETVGNRLITEMQFPSSDGRMIPCVLSMPQGEGPFPMLVTIHGGQGNRDFKYIRSMAAPNGLSPTIAAFNEQPWAIMAISYRAGNGALFGMEQDDVIAGIRFAKTRPKVDPYRVAVVGGSHGGHLALVAAEKMGREFLCVAVGSPWMTDPVVYMNGDPTKPPLSNVPQKAREDLLSNGRRILNGMKIGRRMTDEQIKDFIAEHSIEANAHKIVIPTLFVTSRGDDQAPHALIEPMIERMKANKQQVQVYTAEKSPHGFYWARTVSAARELRGEKTEIEAQEEETSRRTMIDFFSRQFARTDARTENPAESPAEPATRPATDALPPTPQPPQESRSIGNDGQRGLGGGRGLGRRANALRGEERRQGPQAADSESSTPESGTMTREAFKRRLAGSAALANRPEIADRIFDRLDSNGDGSLSQSEYEAMAELRNQFGVRQLQGRPVGPGANRSDAGNGQSTVPSAPAKERTNSPSSAKTAPVRIETGELVGEQQGEVRIFRGIPYAAAPVGDRRWQEAQPREAWNGILDARRFGSPSLQGETFTPRNLQSEDCLFLNIWTPAAAKPEAKLPVLFWIHGGAFIQGSGAQPRYDGTELAKRGAVVITINYRLGPLGLFAHPALTAQSKPDEPLGNYCLLDMLTALRWTQKNIAAFGGNPKNITISGSSAGGTSCLFLMGIPEADGLFHKAIIHSSGGIQNMQSLTEAEAAGVRLAERIGLGASSFATDLRRAAAEDFTPSVSLIRELDLPVKPIIDGRFVTATPADTFAAGKQLRIPVLIGSANGESGARQLGDDVATGGAFGFQRQLADDLLRHGQSVWMFQLTYVPPQARATRSAATHGETVAYAFGTIGQPLAAQYGFRNEQVAASATRARRGGGNRPAGIGREEDSQPIEDSEQGRKISAAMMEYWIAFMRDGKPSGQHLPPWPPHTAAAPKTMVFGNHEIAAK